MDDLDLWLMTLTIKLVRDVIKVNPSQVKLLMAVRESSRTFTMLKRHILYISTILAMKVHDPKSANLSHLGSWTFMAKIVEIYRMCPFNIMNVREHSWTAINHFTWAECTKCDHTSIGSAMRVFKFTNWHTHTLRLTALYCTASKKIW